MQLTLLLCAVLAVGCDHVAERERARTSRSDDATRPTTPPGYEPIEVVNGGTITGTVSWSGEVPELPSTEVTTHREVCGAAQPSPVLAIGRQGGIAGVVVWLEGIRRGRALAVPEQPIEIALEGCRFAPHVVAAPVGARLAFRNADPVLHNVRASLQSGDVWLSRGLPGQGDRIEQAIERAGVVRLVDDAGHPWMLGWVHAFEHPYFAVSDAQGRFQLTGIPSGQYRVRVWHEGIRATGDTEAGRPTYSAPIVLTRPVTVQSGHDTTIDFEITAAAAEAAGN